MQKIDCKKITMEKMFAETYGGLPMTRTLANSDQNRFPLDFQHTFTIILPSVTQTLDNSNPH